MRPAMKPTALELIRDTFVSVLFARERAAGLFYNRLFELAPETRALFHGDMEEQGRMFVETLSKIVTGLDRLDAMLPDVRQLAIRHVRYGVKERHYAIVGSALIHMVRQLSDGEFGAETEQAWIDAYGLVSTAMIDASHDDWSRTNDASLPDAHR